MCTEKIVVVGGGTGSFTVLTGIKQYFQNIVALVNMADDGGSTGVLRDELGALPPGDVRQCLVALSDSPKLRELFNFRFGSGSMQGHAFGNLFLTALEKMTGNFAEGVELASQVLNITGRVEPVTLDNVRLAIEWPDQPVVRGEGVIDTMRFRQSGAQPMLYLEPEATINPAAAAAIIDADMIVIAPGDIYTSLGPILVVGGIREALQASSATKVYICNLVTKPGQTDGFQVHDFVAEIERLAGVSFIDHVLYNRTSPEHRLEAKYSRAREYAVGFSRAAVRSAAYKVHATDIIAKEEVVHSAPHDPIASSRSFIRHDPDKLARALRRLV